MKSDFEKNIIVKIIKKEKWTNFYTNVIS